METERFPFRPPEGDHVIDVQAKLFKQNIGIAIFDNNVMYVTKISGT